MFEKIRAALAEGRQTLEALRRQIGQLKAERAAVAEAPPPEAETLSALDRMITDAGTHYARQFDFRRLLRTDVSIEKTFVSNLPDGPKGPPGSDIALLCWVAPGPGP